MTPLQRSALWFAAGGVMVMGIDTEVTEGASTGYRLYLIAMATAQVLMAIIAFAAMLRAIWDFWTQGLKEGKDNG